MKALRYQLANAKTAANEPDLHRISDIYCKIRPKPFPIEAKLETLMRIVLTIW